MKKIIRILGILLILILALMVLVPYLYQDEIKELILKEVNKELDGEVIIEDISLSLFKSFPDLRVDLSGITVNSDLDTTSALLTTDNISLDLDIISVIKKTESVVVNAFIVSNPDIYIQIDKNGKANYNIYSTDEDVNSQAEETTFDFSIKDYAFNNAKLMFRDLSSGTYMGFDHLNHNGSGTYKGDLLAMNTTTDLQNLNFQSDGTSYLNNGRLNAKVDVIYNTSNGHVNLELGEILINQLNLIVEGWLQPEDEGLDMDLKLSAPNNQFGQLWSIIPPSIKADVKGIKTAGKFNLDGNLKGMYEYETSKLPQMDFDLKVNNGSVVYDALPQSLSSILADISFKKNAGSSGSFINVRDLQFDAGKSYFKTKAEVTQTSNDFIVNGFAHINMNLVDLPTQESYSGLIKTDLSFQGGMHAIQNEEYEDLELDGTASLEDVVIDQSGIPKISINAPQISFSPKRAWSQNTNLTIENSDAAGSIEIINPLGFLTEETRPLLKIISRSSLLDINNMLAAMESSNDQELSSNEESVKDNLFPFDMDIEWTGTIDKLYYEDYDVQNISGEMLSNGQDITINKGTVRYNGSDFKSDAELKNVAQYVNNIGPVSGNISIKGGRIDLNKFMAIPDEQTSEENTSVEEGFVFPENINININSNLKEIIYGDMYLKNVVGDMTLNNQSLNMTNVTTNYLGGDMSLKGIFKSDGKSPARYDLKYDILKMPFEGVVQQVKMIDKIIPISKYIEGIFNSTLVIGGLLGTDMSPDLTSLTASGYIETLKGNLGKLPFLEKISNVVAVKELKGFNLTNTKNWFEIKDGAFIIQPFDYIYEDINLNISGSTSIDRTVSFNIKADIPKEKFDQLPGGSQLNEGVSWLTKEVNKKGLSFGEIKSYMVGIDVGGDVMDPKVKVKMLNFTKGKTSDIIDKTKEEIKDKIIDTLEKKKEEIIKEAEEKATEKIEELKDTLTKEVEKEVDKKVDEVKEEIKKKANEQVDSVLKKQGDEVIDEIKERLKKFDPFKKRKKKD